MCEHGTYKTVLVLPPECSYTGELRWTDKLVDSCIADLVQALNVMGFRTACSCCGHGKEPGDITLHLKFDANDE